MGVRLNKVMGWALTDVTTSGTDGWHPIDDPRINADSRLLTYEDRPSAAEYHEWLVARAARLKAEHVQAGTHFRQAGMDDTVLDRGALADFLAENTRHRPRMSPADAVIHQCEYGLGNVLLLRPLAMHDWHRRDDALDYAAEALSPHAGNHHVQVMPHAPYPFSGSFMDVATGLRLPDAVMGWVRAQSRLREGDLSPLDASLLEYDCDQYAREVGFKDGAAAKDRIVPAVPGEVRALAEFGNLFTNEDVWRALRPAIYTYWA